jgi:hypothetical protein
MDFPAAKAAFPDADYRSVILPPRTDDGQVFSILFWRFWYDVVGVTLDEAWVSKGLLEELLKRLRGFP